MKLFLTSDIKHPEAISHFSNLSPDIFDKKITLIPTARNGKGYGSWKGGDTFRLFRSLAKNLNIVELEDYFQKDIIKEIKQSDVIVFQGGMAAYLLYFLRVTGLENELKDILENSIYVGSSAGAMITSKTQYASAFFIDEPEMGADLVPGLGLIDFEIYPHYKEEQYDKINNLWKKGTLVLLKDGESIIVEDDKIIFTHDKREIVK